jgi:hypothetical protein
LKDREIIDFAKKRKSRDLPLLEYGPEAEGATGLSRGFNPVETPDLYTQFSAGTSDSPATIIDCPEKHRSTCDQDTGWKPGARR